MRSAKFREEEELNYFKLVSIVLNEFPKALRQTFTIMWNESFPSQLWDDSPAVRNLFKSKEGRKTKVSIKKSYEEWDCTDLFQATIFSESFALPDGKGRLKTLSELYVKPRRLPPGCFHSSVLSPNGIRMETFALAIDQLRRLRDTICHCTSTRIDKTTSEQFMQYTKNAFRALGYSTSHIDFLFEESTFLRERIQLLQYLEGDAAGGFISALGSSMHVLRNAVFGEEHLSTVKVAPQHQGPAPEVAAAAAPGPSGPAPEVAAAAAAGPSEPSVDIERIRSLVHLIRDAAGVFISAVGSSMHVMRNAVFGEEHLSTDKVAPQHQGPAPEKAAVAAPGPSVAPQHQGPPPDHEVYVAAAAAPGPSELETRGQMTTNEEASDPVCKDDISRDPAGGVHSPMAMRQKMKEIIKKTIEFEAEHEECIRVLPYLKDDQVLVQFYVFSGESGIPEHLKLAAEKYFTEMEVELEWSDLYNDSDNILKVTPLEYSSGQPKRLNASKVDEISEIISKNLHVLDQHRNVTSVQASFKITKSKQTEEPCIAIYVLGKGFIPVGESKFPHTLGTYPVDVVDGFWFRVDDPWSPTKTQMQSEVLGLGASIGVQGEKASGTLGAIVEDGGTLYALSCDHVIKHSAKSEIIHPGLNDHLNYLKYYLDGYRNGIKQIIERGSSERGVEFSIDSLRDSNELSKKFQELKSIKGRHENSGRSTERKLGGIEVYEKAFEEGLNPPRVIGRYITGIRRNVEWTDGKKYFIDAAIAKLTPKEVNSLENETVEMIGQKLDWGDKPRGECIPTTTIMKVGMLCKNGRSTEYTTTDRVIGASVNPPHFMKPPLFQAKPGDPLLDACISRYFCKSCAESRPNKAEMKETSSESSHHCESCKGDVANLCESLWQKNCLCIYKTTDKFADLGDSGAVIFEEESKLGFGIIFAAHKNGYNFYAIASPLQVALEALSKRISEDSNLRLVLNYVAPQHQGSSPEVAAAAINFEKLALQHQGPAPEEAAAAASGLSVAPQHQGPPPEEAAAAAPVPSWGTPEPNAFT